MKYYYYYYDSKGSQIRTVILMVGKSNIFFADSKIFTSTRIRIQTEFALPRVSGFVLVSRTPRLITEHAPSGVRVGDKRSDSISSSGHVEYLRGKDWI